MIIPTGIGAEIGGHAGDANSAAKLVASSCDRLIVHPNVVNAADINEMSDNCLYVEGSFLDRFLSGEININMKKTPNKILLVSNPPLIADTINSVSASRITLGADIKIVELKTPLIMNAFYDKDGRASGEIEGTKELIKQVRNYDFDVMGVVSIINVQKENAIIYMKYGGVNPWGGVEAMLSKELSRALNKPVVHAPIESETLRGLSMVVDPRQSAEVVSVCYLHCVLKGLNKAPIISNRGFFVDDIDFLLSADCFGYPHEKCIERNIPVIIVEENKTIFPCPEDKKVIRVKNYLEAIGYIQCLKIGILPESVQRPYVYTKIL